MRGMVVMAGLAAMLQTGAAWAAKPVALVEEVSGATPKLQMLDYVNAGQVVELGKGGTLTLGYLASCVHEEITGGRVTIGDRESKVNDGKVERTTVECDGGRLELAANQAVQSGAVAVRSIGTVGEASVTVFDVSPVVSLPKAGRVVIKRVDVVGERHTIEVKPLAPGAEEALRLDLAERSVNLVPGGTYMVSVGGLSQVFHIAESATRGTPLVGRWVPF